MSKHNATQESLAERMSPVRWHGRYFATCCPFHDSEPNNPSFLVFDNGAICLSATCQRRASLQQVYNKIAHIIPNRDVPVQSTSLVPWQTMPDTETLVNQAHEYLLMMPDQAYYLKQRGIEDRIESQQLGWWLGWYTIPVFDLPSRLIGVVLRAGPSAESFHGVRYITPPNQPALLYIPDPALCRAAERIYLVFGVIDALVLTSLRIAAVSPTNLRGCQAAMLEHFRKPIVVVPDLGEEIIARQLVAGLDWRGELLLPKYPKGTKDLADLAKQGRKSDIPRLLTH